MGAGGSHDTDATDGADPGHAAADESQAAGETAGGLEAEGAAVAAEGGAVAAVATCASRRGTEDSMEWQPAERGGGAGVGHEPSQKVGHGPSQRVGHEPPQKVAPVHAPHTTGPQVGAGAGGADAPAPAPAPTSASAPALGGLSLADLMVPGESQGEGSPCPGQEEGHAPATAAAAVLVVEEVPPAEPADPAVLAQCQVLLRQLVEATEGWLLQPLEVREAGGAWRAGRGREGGRPLSTYGRPGSWGTRPESHFKTQLWDSM